MAVVTRYADAAFDPNAGGSRTEIPAQQSKGKLSALLSHIVAVSGDSAASVYHLGKISSSARLVRGDIASDALVAVGGADYDLGSPEFPTGLFTGGSLQPAGSEDVLQSIDIANQTKALWEVMGYAADPVKDIDIILTLLVALTSGGDIRARIEFTVP